MQEERERERERESERDLYPSREEAFGPHFHLGVMLAGLEWEMGGYGGLGMFRAFPTRLEHWEYYRQHGK